MFEYDRRIEPETVVVAAYIAMVTAVMLDLPGASTNLVRECYPMCGRKRRKHPILLLLIPSLSEATNEEDKK